MEAVTKVFKRGDSTSSPTQKRKEKEMAKVQSAQSSCDDLLAPPESKPEQLSGWLHKQGDKGLVKMWKNRWFAFDDQSGLLLYFKGPDDVQPQGHLALSNVISLARDSSDQSDCQFSVVTPDRTYRLKADSHLSMIRWLDRLEEKRKEMNGKGAVNSADVGTSGNTDNVQHPQQQQQQQQDAKLADDVSAPRKSAPAPATVFSVDLTPSPSMSSRKAKDEQNATDLAASGSVSVTRATCSLCGTVYEAVLLLKAEVASLEEETVVKDDVIALLHAQLTILRDGPSSSPVPLT
eukprot:Opistho-2@67101